jgi:hypothetical protein
MSILEQLNQIHRIVLLTINAFLLKILIVQEQSLSMYANRLIVPEMVDTPPKPVMHGEGGGDLYA